MFPLEDGWIFHNPICFVHVLCVKFDPHTVISFDLSGKRRSGEIHLEMPQKKSGGLVP